MLNLTGEESNYYVLEKVLEVVRWEAEASKHLTMQFPDWEAVANELEEFLAPKRIVRDELEELRIAARHGDRQAASELILKLAELNDGR